MSSTAELDAPDPAILADRHVVLLIDDDPETLASLRRCLRKEPYEVVAAGDAREALRLMEERPVDLVLSDQRMPGMCGADLLAEVRRRTPWTQRVLLTGYPGQSRVRFGLGDEIQWLVSKPWNDDGLRLTIRKLLHDGETARAAGARAGPGEGPDERPRARLEARVAERTAELAAEILERKEVEEELRETAALLDHALEGVVVFDAEGACLSANRSACELLRLSAEAALGRPWSDFVSPDDRPAAAAAIERMQASGNADVELRALADGGTALPIRLVLVRASARPGRPARFYAFLWDLSERARVAAQLLQGQKLQAIGQLAAGIAHEINNPVGYILSNLSTLGGYAREIAELVPPGRRDDAETGFLLDDFAKAVEDSRLGAERIRDIVRSLRAFAHVDEDGREPTDLAKLLEEALRITGNELKYKAVVRRDFGEVPPVPCRPLGLEQVFVNLLLNAVQAIPKRGEILLSTRVEGEEAVVRVRDDGTGIAPEHQRRLFEPFFTTKPAGQGTGLGLHMARKIVEAHGGRMEVRSEPGQGTEFAVRLPLKERGSGGGKGKEARP